MPLQPDRLAQIVVDVSSGILFAMFDGDKRVVCEVEWGALTDRAIVDGDDESDARAAFERHREKIYAIASQNYDAGEKWPCVTTYQLTDLG
ncbi:MULTISPECIES: DUF1488 family protein [Bradyrhizobium]|uniref:DUF1488 family protein n=1 Tax=Bradyrhizobium TaxID=374 RepID=UPI001EDC846F|nr:DUF1488 family protein [Bradyrhizobium zhengyangense]MCG2645582.1 DUF1488 domain-containing protein [Bradyrhizobium zhengyangense]